MPNINTTKRGFTLIELLVVISIIGILSTLSVVSLNSARQKARDAKRLSDLRQVQTALELYVETRGGYPSVANASPLGSGSFSCLDEDGFVTSCDLDGMTFMGQVPAAPTTPPGGAYLYCSTTIAAPSTCAASTESYRITFILESTTAGLNPGPHVATPYGFQ